MNNYMISKVVFQIDILTLDEYAYDPLYKSQTSCHEP